MVQRIRDEVMDILRLKPSTAESMANLIGVNKSEIYWAIHNLRREGYKIVNINGKYKITTNTAEIKAEANKLKKIGRGYFVTCAAMNKENKKRYEQLNLF